MKSAVGPQKNAKHSLNIISVLGKRTLKLCLDSLFFVGLFHYLTYFCYYLWTLLHFLGLFMNFTVLF